MSAGTRPPEFRGDPEAREANRLYWDTDESVNGIAERLELSKGRLYDLLTPLPVDVECPQCGGPLGYENRTARDRQIASCPLCPFEAPLEDAAAPGAHPASRPAPGAGYSDRTLVGAAMVGVAVGLALGRWLRG